MAQRVGGRPGGSVGIRALQGSAGVEGRRRGSRPERRQVPRAAVSGVAPEARAARAARLGRARQPRHRRRGGEAPPMARHQPPRARTAKADVAPNARPRIGQPKRRHGRRQRQIVRRPSTDPRRRVRARGRGERRRRRRRQLDVSPQQNRKRSARQRQGSTGGTEERVVPGPEVRRHRRRRRAAPAGGAAPVRPRAAAEQARVSPAVRQAGPEGPRRHVGLAHRRPPAP